MTTEPTAPPPLDRRRHLYREDAAAEPLRGQVAARMFLQPERRQIVRAVAALRRAPDDHAGLETEALFGEQVDVYETRDGWCWVQLSGDRYVGYLRREVLGDVGLDPTHRVAAIGTFVYPDADIKAPPLMPLSLGALLAIEASEPPFLRLATGGYVIARHVAEAGRFAHDFVDVAERFIGVPYLWGGRTRLGLDCSGLVQIAMQASGIDAPRDADMQRDEIGSDVLITDELEGLQRGDLVCWAGHIGIMTDGVMLLHANSHHMAVAAETLAAAAARIAKTGSEIVAIKRPDPLRST